MIIIGAGNLGKHIIDQLTQDNYIGELAFFDEACNNASIYEKFQIIHDWQDFYNRLETTDNSFFIAIGNPRKRERIFRKIIGGIYTSVISKHANIISTYSQIGDGSLIQPGCCISHNVRIGKSNIIHANSLIGHDVFIDDFVSIGSNVNILKGVDVGKYSIISPNCLIMDNVKIGKNVFIEPGVVVRNDVPDNETIEYPF